MATQTTKLPLKLRIKAWWEGYDVDALNTHLNGGEDDGDSASTQPEEDKPAGWEDRTLDAFDDGEAPDADEGETDQEDVEDLPLDPWDEQRADVAQLIWGEGYCGPGGTDHIISMSKLLALSPEMSMVEIGSSLGGPARTLADHFGAWVSGYEASEKLVELANEKSMMAGLSKKATIHTFDPDGELDFDRKFDRAFSKECLHTILDKKAVIAAVEDKLKPGGLMLITDYVIGDPSVISTDDYKAWQKQERRRPKPITSDELIEMCKDIGMMVRVSEDISDQYIKMISKAWAGAEDVVAQLSKEEDGATLVKVLLREAEIWQNRSRLLKSGGLNVWRLLISKKADKPSMMSDW